MKEKSSIKSKLVRIIGRRFLEDMLFSDIKEVESGLQNELDMYLRFETSVFISIDNNFTVVDIYFEDGGNKKCITITIEVNSLEKNK